MAIPPDDIVWTGRLAGVMRPMAPATFRNAMTVGGVLGALAELAMVPWLLGWFDLVDAHRGAQSVLFLGGLVPTITLLAVLRRMPDRLIPTLGPVLTVAVFSSAIVLVNASVVFAGPNVGVAAVYLVEAPLLIFLVVRRPWAIAFTVGQMVGYGVALVALDHVAVPLMHWVLVVLAVAATSVLVGGMTNRLDEARRAEQEARSRLADVNRRLRRFLDPQVADAVASHQELLAPHRRSIAALFVDLRGFTHFTNSVEPERVVDVLADYYAAVGTLVDKHGGTLGGFDGDGIFAFFGDPVPSETAAGDALAMARDTATRLDELTRRWADEHAPLGYGIGLAFGDATVGLVGFEGRLDYTPVGAVVNLAARMCADAKNGEIVIDATLRNAAGVKRPRRRAPVDLKGFGEMATFGVSH